jgi:Flp pilus assembly protein TadB
MQQIGVFAFLIVAVICVFTFTSIASWAEARRKERVAYYKSETLKKIAETQGAGGATALEFLREEDRIVTRRAREGMKLGGLVMIAVGASLMIFLGTLVTENRGVMEVGVIPLLIGVALLVYAYWLAPKDADSKNAPADR